MSYRIIVLDLDGTLTNSRKEITKPTKDALLEIQEAGCKVVLASGRPTPGVAGLAKELELAKYGGYMLAFNGGRIIDCKTGQVIYQKTLPPETIPEIYEAALKHGVGIITYTEDEIIAGTAIDRYMEKEQMINQVPIRQVDNFTEYVDFPVNKCLLTGDGDYLAEVEVKMQKQFGKYLGIYRSEPFFLEVVPQNIDKAHSLLKLLSSIGMTAEEMICCGDGFNDISMIECAGLGVAMENAQELVKASADYITKSNDEDGILHVIRKFLK